MELKRSHVVSFLRVLANNKRAGDSTQTCVERERCATAGCAVPRRAPPLLATPTAMMRELEEVGHLIGGGGDRRLPARLWRAVQAKAVKPFD